MSQFKDFYFNSHPKFHSSGVYHSNHYEKPEEKDIYHNGYLAGKRDGYILCADDLGTQILTTDEPNTPTNLLLSGIVLSTCGLVLFATRQVKPRYFGRLFSKRFT